MAAEQFGFGFDAGAGFDFGGQGGFDFSGPPDPHAETRRKQREREQQARREQERQQRERAERERQDREQRERYNRARHTHSFEDPYEVLGVPRDASRADIRKAWAKLCKLNHPDVGGQEEALKRINRAYEALKGRR